MSPTFILILNAFTYTFFTYYLYKKSSHLNIGTYVVAWFSFIAWMAILYYNHDLYQYFRGKENFTLTPFIYLFIAICLFLQPIIQYDSSKIQKVRLINEKFLQKYIYIMLVIQLLGLLAIFPTIYKILLTGSSAEFRMESYDNANIIVISNPILAKMKTLSSSFQTINVIVASYILLFTSKYLKFKKLFFITSVLIFPIYMTILGNRFYVMAQLVWMLFIFIFLRNFIKKKIQKKLFTYFLVVLGIALVPFIIISIGRFGDMIEYQLYRYIGEPFINYNVQFFYDLKNETWGSAYFSVFRNWLGFPTEFQTLVEKWAYIDSITGIDSHVFYTFIGGFNIEFGFLNTLIIGFLIFILYKKLCKSDTILTLPKFIILCYWGYVCIQGAFLFPLQGTGNIEIICVILSYIVFKKYSISKYYVSNNRKS